MALLRIHLDSVDASITTIRLEGKLLLDWIGPLREVYEQAASRSPSVVFEMRGISYIDTFSVAVLHEWQRRGLVLTHCSPWIAELLKEI